MTVGMGDLHVSGAADRWRREALERLGKRTMPLPGRPGSGLAWHAVPAPPVAASGGAAVERADGRPPRPALTDREVQVLRTWLMLDSKPAAAAALFISLGTVNTHLTRIRAKYADLGRRASTKAALVARAVQDGIIDLDEL